MVGGVIDRLAALRTLAAGLHFRLLGSALQVIAMTPATKAATTYPRIGDPGCGCWFVHCDTLASLAGLSWIREYQVLQDTLGSAR